MRFVVQSHTSHLDPINDNIIVLINKLREVFRGFQGDFRELVQIGECALQDAQKGLEIIMDLPSAQTKMKAKCIEGRIGFEIDREQKISVLRDSKKRLVSRPSGAV